jgi:hypothetical protein
MGLALALALVSALAVVAVAVAGAAAVTAAEAATAAEAEASCHPPRRKGACKTRDQSTSQGLGHGPRPTTRGPWAMDNRGEEQWPRPQGPRPPAHRPLTIDHRPTTIGRVVREKRE